MRRTLPLLTFVVSACAPAAAPPSPARTPLESLRHSIDSLVNDPNFANAQLGLLNVDPKTSDTLYTRNAGKLYMQATNHKIIT
jgi:D-alanyl-D-alanine carboxypeptidase